MHLTDCIQKLITEKYDNKILPWNKSNKIKIILKSIITAIKVENKIFVIGVSHAENNSLKNICVNEELYYELSKNIFRVPEIDLVIFEEKPDIENVTDLFTISDISELNINVGSINHNDIFSFIIPFNGNYMSLQCTIDKLTKLKYNNACYPEMPIFIGDVTDNSMESLNNDITLIKGASGTPIYRDNKIYGFLSGCYNSKQILIIPIFMVTRVIKEIIETKYFNGLCKSYFELSCLNSTTFITQIYKVDYNMYLNRYKKNSRIKKNDIILKIDNNSVINNKIYDENLQLFVDVDTYFIINKTISSSNNFLISRPNNIKKLIDIKTGNCDINSCINFDILSNRLNYHIIENNYVYVEINSLLFSILINYRYFSEDDQIYSKIKLKYNNNIPKMVLLCDTLDKSYSIFNNEKIKVDFRDIKYLKSNHFDLNLDKLKLN